MVYFDADDAKARAKRLAEKGVLALPMSEKRIRVVFHLDVNDEDLERAVKVCRKLFSQ